MLSLVGFAIVLISVVLGYVLHHGVLGVLYQPTELLIIGGAALGAMIASSSLHVIKSVVAECLGVLKGSGVSKRKYLELLLCFNELFRLATANPIAIETHVENPETSEIFKKYPLILHDHHVMVFICNTFQLQLSSTLSPYDLEDLMDQDIQVMHEEEKAVPATLSRLADALPGLGIVAAVLGVVITMGKLTEGKEVIGQSVAAALVGTFLGILLCYGIFQPLSARVEALIEEKGKIFFVIKAGILAYAKGSKTPACLEFTRRNIPLEHRPTFKEVEEAVKNKAA
jgi:chemotaxis protein MotA